MYDKNKNKNKKQETETKRDAKREREKRIITIIGSIVGIVSTFGWMYWRGHVWNCRNKIKLLLPVSTSHITKNIEALLLHSAMPLPHHLTLVFI